MIRTQVYLPKTLYQDIDLIARREKKKKAQLVREILEIGLKEKKSVNVGDSLLKLAKIGARGPKDLSLQIDKYLYGE